MYIHTRRSVSGASTDCPMSPSHSILRTPAQPPKSPPPIQPKPSSIKRPAVAPKPPNLVVVTAENGERRSTLYSDVEVRDGSGTGVRESSFEEVAYVTVRRPPS